MYACTTRAAKLAVQPSEASESITSVCLREECNTFSEKKTCAGCFFCTSILQTNIKYMQTNTNEPSWRILATNLRWSLVFNQCLFELVVGTLGRITKLSCGFVNWKSENQRGLLLPPVIQRSFKNAICDVFCFIFSHERQLGFKRTHLMRTLTSLDLCTRRRRDQHIVDSFLRWNSSSFQQRLFGPLLPCRKIYPLLTIRENHEHPRAFRLAPLRSTPLHFIGEIRSEKRHNSTHPQTDS